MSQTPDERIADIQKSVDVSKVMPLMFWPGDVEYLLAALATSEARCRELEQERDRFKRIAELEQRAAEQWMPCPDCRDKVRHEGCQRCAKQQAESRCRQLEQALKPFAAMVHEDGVDAPYPEDVWIPLLQAAKDALNG